MYQGSNDPHIFVGTLVSCDVVFPLSSTSINHSIVLLRAQLGKL